MKLNVLFLLFVAFIIISQDKKEMSTGQASGPSGGGTFAGHKYVTAPNLDGVFRDMNPYFGRVHGTFHYNSPESWQPMAPSCPAQNKASMINVAGRGPVTGIPHVPTGVEPYAGDLQSFNLVK